jgi:MFS family permease
MKITGISRNVAIVHANVAVYALAYWLTQPLLPFLMRELGASNLELGALQSLFNIVQVAGGLVIGFLQDRYSGAGALSFVQAGSAVVYLLLFSATSVQMLYISRIPTVLQQAMQVSQAFISKQTAPKDRAVAMARVSLSYSVGMVAGSLASGRLAEALGMRAVAAIAAALCLCAVVANKLFLEPGDGNVAMDAAGAAKKFDGPDAAAPSPTESPGTHAKETTYLDLVLHVPRVLSFLVLLYLTRALFEPVNSLTMIDQYGFTKTGMGTFASFMAGVSVLNSLVVLPLALKYVPEKTLTRTLVCAAAGGYAVLGFLPMDDYRAYIAVITLLGAVGSMLYNLSASYIAANTPRRSHGRAIALTHALRSGVGIVSPIVATWTLDAYGPSFVSCVNAMSLAMAAVVMS